MKFRVRVRVMVIFKNIITQLHKCLLKYEFPLGNNFIIGMDCKNTLLLGKKE